MRTVLAALGLLSVGFLATPANATLSIRITDSTGTTTYTAVEHNISPTSTTLVAAQSDGDFAINIQVGTSNSPGVGTAKLTLSGTVDTLEAPAGGFPNLLTIEVSDTDFLVPVGTESLIQTVNTNTPAATAAPGTLTATGYADNGNHLFCQNAPGNVCTATTPTANFNSFLVSNPGATDTVPTNLVAPFSLDQVLVYSFAATTAPNTTALVSSTLTASNVPEPAGVVLLGTLLVGLTTVIRKKTASKSV